MCLTNKEKYRKLCEQEITLPVFSKDWWLDAVSTNGEWDVVLIEKGGEIVAAWPFFLIKKKGFRLITMPCLTQSLGIWIKYPQNQKYVTRLSYEKKIIGELINKLPQFDFLSQNFFLFLTNWLPFYWRGFQQTTRYTYRIDLSRSLAEIESDLDQDNRKAIKKGKSGNLEVVEENNIDSLFLLVKKTFLRQKTQVPFSKEFLMKLHAAALRHNLGKVYVAKVGGIPIAAGLFVVDSEAIYYLVGGFDQEHAAIRPMNFLLWAVICEAKKMGIKHFDFEGSMIEDVEGFFRSFGATQTPYFNIHKTPSKILRLYKFIKGYLC